MPDGFFRANRSIDFNEIGDPISTVFKAHPIQPGKNQGGVNNYVFDPTSASFDKDFCLLYDNFVNQTVRSLYPNPKGALREALNFNLNIFYNALQDPACQQLFPFGKWGSRRLNNFYLLGDIVLRLKDFGLFCCYFTMISMILGFDKFMSPPLAINRRFKLYPPHFVWHEFEVINFSLFVVLQVVHFKVVCTNMAGGRGICRLTTRCTLLWNSIYKNMTLMH